AVAMARVGRPFDEVAGGHAPVELLIGQEVVGAAVDLAGPRLARRRRHRQLQLGDPLHEAPDERALADPRGAGDHEHPAHGCRYLRSSETSSARWRSERPPIVLLGEMRQFVRILLTLTRPYLGTASSMSKTLAVS